MPRNRAGTLAGCETHPVRRTACSGAPSTCLGQRVSHPLPSHGWRRLHGTFRACTTRLHPGIPNWPLARPVASAAARTSVAATSARRARAGARASSSSSRSRCPRASVRIRNACARAACVQSLPNCETPDDHEPIGALHPRASRVTGPRDPRRGYPELNGDLRLRAAVSGEHGDLVRGERTWRLPGVRHPRPPCRVRRRSRWRPASRRRRCSHGPCAESSRCSPDMSIVHVDREHRSGSCCGHTVDRVREFQRQRHALCTCQGCDVA